MKTKFKVRIVALTAALLMLLSAFCSFGIVAAHAGEVSDEDNKNYVFPEPTPDGELNTDSGLTSLYYFTNYSESKFPIYDDYISSLIEQNPYIEFSEFNEWSYLNSTEGFWKEMEEYYYGRGKTIENALIIFEVRGEIDWKLGIYNGTEEQSEIDGRYEKSIYYPLMKEMFSNWKSLGCKIAFICETDEVWFENNYDEFLDYVDIHINLDILTSFAYSVADIILSQNFLGSVLVLDSHLSSWFKEDYLIPYLAFIYREKYGELNYSMPENILSELRMTCYNYNSEVYTDISGNLISKYEVYQNYSQAQSAFIVGEISNQDDKELINLYNKNYNSQYYACNLYGNNVVAFYDHLIYAGWSKKSVNNHLSVILRDFILNDYYSLLKYNNWSGRCMISFKLIYGDGGWLRRAKAYTVPPDPIDGQWDD